MNIAFLAPYHPTKGGIAQFTVIYAHLLKEQGHNVKVFSFSKQLIFENKNRISPGKNPIPVECQRILNPYNPITWIKTYRVIRKWNPNTLIVKYWDPGIGLSILSILSLLKYRTSIKTILNIDNFSLEGDSFYYKLLTKLITIKSDIILTLSQNVTDQLNQKINVNKTKIFTVQHPNYDFYKHFTISSKENIRDKYHITAKNIILFFGVVKKNKGLDLLLDAMPRIVSQIDDLQLLIVGETQNNEEKYEKMIKDNNLEAFVRFENRFIKDEEITEIFSVSDVIVLPYKKANQSGIIQVAFSLNTPVISTNIEGIKEAIENQITGILADDDSPFSIANAVIDFYKNNKKELFINNIKKSRDRFSWKKLIHQTELIIKES